MPWLTALACFLPLLLKCQVISESSEETTLQDQTAARLYHEGLDMINGTQRRYARGISLLTRAASMGHMEAKRQIAVEYLFGDYLPFNFTESRCLFSELSEKNGDPTSQFYLGFIYANGLGVNSSQHKAIIHYTFAAASGSLYGQMALAYRQLKFVNLVGGCNEALPLYSNVAGQVASSIKFDSGPVVHRLRLIDESERASSKSGVMLDEEVMQYYQLLAERGDINAQSILGTLFYTGGRGVKSNYKRALYYFKKAAESGSMSAVSYMGKIYAQGDEFVQQDTGKALRFLRHAAEKGDDIGQSGLALMYYHGIGVAKDYELAKNYFGLAAEQKNVDAFLWLAIMYYNGDGVEKNLRAAVEYFTLAAQGGHVLGPYYLAKINANGPGLLRQCETSADLFKTVAERGKWSMLFMDAYHDYKHGKVNQALMKYLLLAELGYEEAQVNAAFLLDKGKTTLFDRDDSLRCTFSLYSRAGNQGSAYSKVRLGDFYYYGLGGTQVDLNAAVAQYKSAADLNNDAQAMFNLGYMYETGLGLEKDLHLAKRFYDRAFSASDDAYLPVTLALFKLKFKFLQRNLERWIVVRRSANLFQEMKALRIGTILSGLIILVALIWVRPF